MIRRVEKVQVFLLSLARLSPPLRLLLLAGLAGGDWPRSGSNYGWKTRRGERENPRKASCSTKTVFFIGRIQISVVGVCASRSETRLPLH